MYTKNQAVPSSRPRPKRGKMVLVLGGILAVLAIAAGVQLFLRQQAAGNEKTAMTQLKGMGAIVVANAGKASSAVLSIPGRDIDLSAALPLVLKLRNLESLDVSNSSVNDEQLKVVGQVTWIKNLNLTNTPIGDDQIKYFVGLPKLKSLYLAKTKITSAALSELATMSTLETLDINGCSSVSGGFEPLANLSSLTMMNAGGLLIADEDVEALTKIPNLRRLDLTGAEISPGALETLQEKIPQIGR